MVAKRKIDPIESLFLGLWRIEEMPDFDKDVIDEDGPAHIEFEAEGTGNLHFVCVHGEMDVRFTMRAGQPCAEFAWIGSDENDDVFGRGIAWIDKAGRMTGTIFLFQGDEHDFVAEKEVVKARKKPAPARSKISKKK